MIRLIYRAALTGAILGSVDATAALPQSTMLATTQATVEGQSQSDAGSTPGFYSSFTGRQVEGIGAANASSQLTVSTTANSFDLSSYVGVSQDTFVSPTAGLGTTATSNGQFYLYFKIAGPTPTVQLDLSLNGSLKRGEIPTSTSGDDRADSLQSISVLVSNSQNQAEMPLLGAASLSENYLSSNAFFGSIQDPNALTTAPFETMLSGSGSFSVRTGVTYMIAITAMNSLTLDRNGPFRFVNGFVTLNNFNLALDNSVSNASFYNLALSMPQLAAPVPEPAEWATMAAGLLMAVGMARQRRAI